ncbi:hypothetical protein TgHK011_008155 [Trichoderma gracile]|nr:hypothetical protein TgHK011_008155 [Trichoderma gracile]
MGVDNVPRPLYSSVLDVRLDIRWLSQSVSSRAKRKSGGSRAWVVLALAERTGATAEAQVEKAPRTRRQCAGLAGARAANLPASQAKDVAESLARERWGTWALSKDGDRASEKGRCERISSKGWIEVGRFSPAPSCKDEWMGRRWQSGWASTKVWSVGTALLAGSAGKIRWVVQKGWALQKTHWSTGTAGDPS